MIRYRKLFNRRLLPKLVVYFYVLTTILILIFNDVFGDEDGFIVFSLFFFTSMFILMVRWTFIQVKSILRLKKEKKDAELMHLRSQVNPHFFFNTLNNLYGLIGQDTDKAQQLVLKLSDMMRYSIYEGQNDWVALDDEITYLENYIDLHRMRYHKSIDVNFSIEVEDRSVKIMPLLFIIMLENAFKHGVEKLRKDAYVYIRLKATRQMVEFEIENNFDMEEMDGKAGIGLENLRKRLALVYANRHELEVSTLQTGIYRARLRFDL